MHMLRFSSDQMFVFYITVSVRYLTVIESWCQHFIICFEDGSYLSTGSLHLGIIEWHPWLKEFYLHIYTFFSSLQFLPANAVNNRFLLLIAIDVADWSFPLTIIASINFFSMPLFWWPIILNLSNSCYPEYKSPCSEGSLLQKYTLPAVARFQPWPQFFI